MTEYKIKTVERCKNLFLPGFGYVELTDNEITLELPDPIAENLKKCDNFKMTEIKQAVPKPVKEKPHKPRAKTKKTTKKD